MITPLAPSTPTSLKPLLHKTTVFSTKKSVDHQFQPPTAQPHNRWHRLQHVQRPARQCARPTENDFCGPAAPIFQRKPAANATTATTPTPTTTAAASTTTIPNRGIRPNPVTNYTIVPADNSQSSGNSFTSHAIASTATAYTSAATADVAATHSQPIHRNSTQNVHNFPARPRNHHHLSLTTATTTSPHPTTQTTAAQQLGHRDGHRQQLLRQHLINQLQ